MNVDFRYFITLVITFASDFAWASESGSSIEPTMLETNSPAVISQAQSSFTDIPHPNDMLQFFVYFIVLAMVLFFIIRHFKRVRITENQSQQSQYLLETVYDLSRQAIGIVDEKGRLISSNQTLQEWVYDPNFDYAHPVWTYGGWGEASGEKVQQAYLKAQQEGVVRLEVELIRTNIGPIILDLSIKKLPTVDGHDEQYLFEGKDITAHKLAEKRLIENEAKFRNYYQLQPVMMLTLDEHDCIQAANKFTSEILGYDNLQILGRKLQSFYAQTSEISALEKLRQPQKKHALVARREIQYIDHMGQSVWIRENIRQIPETRQLLIVGEDITETHLLAEQLEYQAHYDGLTGLYNRYHFEQQLVTALKEVKGNIRVHALFYLDLDQFKLINDTVGHEAGDAAIVYVAELLAQLIPQKVTLARTGGDEFAILLRDCDEEEVRQFAQSILDAFNQSQFMWRGIHFNLNCSIGIRKIDYTAKSVQRVNAQADTACHLAKEEGRNRAHFYNGDDKSFRHRELEMACVNQVHDALANDRVELYAQPILDISSSPSDKLHFEILVRLRDKNDKLMSPGIFMPAIERYNLAHLIDRQVFKQTLAWFEDRPDTIDKLGRCSINLSGQSMGDKDFIAFLIDLLQNTTVPTEKICIEITETAAVGNMLQASQLFTRLKQLGCKIALDDFGSGLSSFAYLKTLPLDIVKIDGCFVRDMHQDEVDYILVKSIHNLVKQLGKQTVAEFVENDEILSCLIDLGVDYAQGYLISAPKPLAQLVEEFIPQPASSYLPDNG
ncbi:EAL domain-containing protein [Vibrio algivorus]|uniref:EAL domain-containing protein n=2 Tax=Vibrio algivorus TaxID=1667024 RepID=A0A557PBF3_9VIBR|nr:EAL domain-containing protein [Vibrio algivorus]